MDAFAPFQGTLLNFLLQAREGCDFLIAGVMADDVLMALGGTKPVAPLADRLEVIRHVSPVDAAIPAMTGDVIEIWRALRFDVLFRADALRGTDESRRLERDLAEIGVEVVCVRWTRRIAGGEAYRISRSGAGNGTGGSLLPVGGISGPLMQMWGAGN